MKAVREEFSVFKNAQGEYFHEQNKEKNLEEVKLAVQRPTSLHKQQADYEYYKQMNRLLSDGIKPKVILEKTIRENGIWDDEKEKEANLLARRVWEAREKLQKGRIKLSEGAKIAKEAIKNNYDYLQLVMDKNNILNNAAENIAENHKFNYLVSVCTVYNNGESKSFFRDYDDFLRQDTLGNPVTNIAGLKFSTLLYGLNEDYRKDWPEFKFLAKYKFVNEKLEPVNKDGVLVDDDGKPLDLPGQPKVDEAEPEFLPDDEEGNPPLQNPTENVAVDKSEDVLVSV